MGRSHMRPGSILLLCLYMFFCSLRPKVITLFTAAGRRDYAFSLPAAASVIKPMMVAMESICPLLAMVSEYF